MEKSQQIAVQTILKLMEQHGFTQTELAKKADIANDHLNKILNGKRRLGISTARSIAAVFGIDADDLYFGENLQQPSFTFEDAGALLRAFEKAPHGVQTLVWNLLHNLDDDSLVAEVLRESGRQAKPKGS